MINIFNIKYFIPSLILVLGFSACINPPDYPVEPVISFDSMTKNTMNQDILGLRDSTFVFIKFTDGDGDLGADNNSTSLFLIDTRQPNAEVTGYAIPKIPEEGSGNGINGRIRIKLYTSCCIYPDGFPACQPYAAYPTDTLVYQLYIKDRAGNESNRISLPPLILRCN